MLQSIFITGLGGQGIVTMAGILSEHAADCGLRVSLFDAKGMAQRGGRVTSEIRLSDEPALDFGARIFPGGADVLVGMEIGETISSASFLRQGGIAILLDHAQLPAETVVKKKPYPALQEARELLAARAGTVFAVERAQSPHNMFVLGVFAVVVPEASPELSLYSADGVRRRIEGRLKRGLQESLESFREGCEHGRSLLRRV